MSFPRYPAYKDSGVERLGEVPIGWTLLKLKRIARLQSGEFITSDAIEQDGLYPVYGGNGLRGYSTEYTHNGTYALIGRQGALCGNINYAEGKFWASEHAVVVYPERNLVTHWLGELLRSMDLGQYSVSAAQPGLSTERIADLYIPLPTKEEQVKIARFLDHETAKIDALIQEQQRLIELLKEKRQAVISHAVTKGLDPSVPMKDSGVEWLGEVPEHWRVSQLKFNTLLMQTGPFGSQLHAEDYIQDGVPLVNPAHMKDGKIIPDSQASVDQDTWHRLERHQLSPGELVFARRGELGRCAVVTEAQKGWLCGTGSLKAKLNAKLLPEYAYLLVTSKGVVSELSLESKGSTMENLNTETLGRVRLPLPPPPEQKQILDYVARLSGSFGSLIQEAQAAIEIISERRSALISAAVTGKIDVRNWKPPADETAFDEEVRQAGLEVVS